MKVTIDLENLEELVLTTMNSSVLSILTANETYRQIENNIKCIADKRE